MKFSRIDGDFYLEEVHNLFFTARDYKLEINETPMYGSSTDLKDLMEPCTALAQVNNITHIVEVCDKLSDNKFFIKAKIFGTAKGKSLLKYIYSLITPELCKIILSCDNDFETELDTLTFGAQAHVPKEEVIRILTFNIVQDDNS